MRKRHLLLALAALGLLLLLGAAALLLAPDARSPVPRPPLEPSKGQPMVDERVPKRFRVSEEPLLSEQAMHKQLKAGMEGKTLKDLTRSNWREVANLFPDEAEMFAACAVLITHDTKVCEWVETSRIPPELKGVCMDMLPVMAYLNSKGDLASLKAAWPVSLHADFERLFKRNKAACESEKQRAMFYGGCLLNARAPELADKKSMPLGPYFRGDSAELENPRDFKWLEKLPEKWRRPIALLRKAYGGDEQACFEMLHGQ